MSEFNMNDLLAQAMKMQEHLAAAQQNAASTTVEGVSGGGVVKITATGTLEFQSVRIDPNVVDRNDVAMLEDLILAAIHDAAAKAAALTQDAMSGLDMGGLDLGGSGLGGSGLGGLLG